MARHSSDVVGVVISLFPSIYFDFFSVMDAETTVVSINTSELSDLEKVWFGQCNYFHRYREKNEMVMKRNCFLIALIIRTCFLTANKSSVTVLPLGSGVDWDCFCVSD